jgi:MbtH protein
MSSPFDKQEGRFLVLTNERGQYSLWPSFIQVPGGWTSRAEGGRQDCLDYIRENWIDMRPKTSAEEMESDLPSSKN